MELSSEESFKIIHFVQDDIAKLKLGIRRTCGSL